MDQSAERETDSIAHSALFVYTISPRICKESHWLSISLSLLVEPIMSSSFYK